MGTAHPGFTLLTHNIEMKHIHLTLIIYSLSGTGGGMERAATTLVNAWSRRGYKVSLLTLDAPTAQPLYPLAEGVELCQLDINRPAANKLMAIKRMGLSVWTLRRTILRLETDVVVSFGDQTCILAIAGCLGLKIPVLAAERTHPAHYSLGRGWGTLRKWLYPHAAALVAQTSDLAEWYRENIPSVRTEVIPNPVLPSPIKHHPSCTGQKKTIAGAGLLAEVKQFDLLITAFEPLAAKHPQLNLVIYGDGPDRDKLQQLIIEKGLEGRVSLPGRVKNLSAHLARADMFVLTSRTEGFPNALCEAMACGLPVVAFACPSGPADIIRHGVDGFLVPPGDVEMLTAKTEELISNNDLMQLFSANASEIVSRFSLEQVLGKWDILIHEVHTPFRHAYNRSA